MGTILLIEDDHGIRDALQEILENEGREVLTAAHGREALSLLEDIDAAEAPCLVLLDLTMPQMSGAEFLRYFDQLERFSETPVALFSASAAPVDLPRVSEVLRKPVDLDVLLAVVDKYCPVTR
jgi:CheY-like chemotaxis protein